MKWTYSSRVEWRTELNTRPSYYMQFMEGWKWTISWNVLGHSNHHLNSYICCDQEGNAGDAVLGNLNQTAFYPARQIINGICLVGRNSSGGETNKNRMFIWRSWEYLDFYSDVCKTCFSVFFLFFFAYLWIFYIYLFSCFSFHFSQRYLWEVARKFLAVFWK